MIDPIVSLSFSIHSNPGVYALLLGSGMSRSAAIPTGWEIVQDLVHKIALMEGQEPAPDPEQWYRLKYQTDPEYSDLLDKLARTPAERAQILRSYFEPTEEEHEHNQKLPTPAHRAIAELVKAGFVRVIVSTNFDRLIEAALVDAGVQPVVVSSADAAHGVMPLPHVRCLILKINGDYLDSRIKNTKSELEQYEPALNALLDRILDEFGLIVCGWSAEWDIALRAAIERCPTRRFTTYWAARGEPTGKAADLISLRSALLVRIDTADAFFQTLKEKVMTLTQLAHAHPLSTKLATAQTKRYLPREEDRILLHDLIFQTTEDAYRLMDPKDFHTGPVPHALGEVARRLIAYQAIVELPMAIMIAGCFWGESKHEYLWQHMLSRFGDPPGYSSGRIAWIALRRYPASLMMYGGGIAAIAAGRYKNLAAVLNAPVSPQGEKKKSAAEQLNVAQVLRDNAVKFIPGKQDRHTPYSDHLFEVLREPLRTYIPTDTAYEDAFLWFEYLLGVVIWHKDDTWAPVGRCRWKSSAMFTMDGPTSPSSPRVMEAAAALFSNGVTDYQAAKKQYDSWVVQNTPTWDF